MLFIMSTICHKQSLHRKDDLEMKENWKFILLNIDKVKKYEREKFLDNNILIFKDSSKRKMRIFKYCKEK